MLSRETNVSDPSIELLNRCRPPNDIIKDESQSLLTVENSDLAKDELKSNPVNYQYNNQNTKTEDEKCIKSELQDISSVHPTSYLDTLINVLKGNIGCGILAMGDAFKNGGLFLSPVLTFVIAVISVYNQHLLVACSKGVKEKLKLKHNPEFAETVELSIQSGPQKFRSYSVFFRNSVNILIIITQLGLCCIYIIFVSKSIQQVTHWYNIELDTNMSILVTIVPIMISSLIRNLKFIARLSAIANLCMLVGLIIILYYCSIDLPPVSSRIFVAHWTSIPLFFGTSLFAFEGISLVLPLEQEMKKPKQFSTVFGVLNVGMAIVTSLIILTGFMGYLRFGDEVRGSLTLNLPQEFLLSKIVVLSMMFNITCSFTLQFYIPVEIMWPFFVNKFGPFKFNLLWYMGFRVILVLFTFAAAATIPHLSLFISLLGSVAGTFLALIFPPLCHLATATAAGRHRSGPLAWRLCMDGVTLALGAVGFVTGTYVSVRELSAELRAVTRAG